MTIVEYIRDKVAEIDTQIFFGHGPQSLLNEKDPVRFPVVYLDDPIYSNDTFNQAGYLKEVYPVKMFFGDKSDLQWTAEQHYEVIEPMRTLSRVFLAKIYKDSEYIKSIANVRRYDIMNLMDVNMSGIWLLVDLELANNNSNC